LTEEVAEATPPGVGTELARAREARGWSLADVSQILKFAPRQLEALEQDRFERLPGSTIARGMVRNYARLLNLDPEPLLARMAGKLAVPDAERLASCYSEPVPFHDNARRSTMLYLGLSLGVLLVGGGVGYEWFHERDVVRQPAVVAAASQTLDVPTSPAPAPVVEAPQPAQTPQPESIKVDERKPGEGKAVPGGRRLVLRADREAWIEVKDGADRVLLSSLNPAGSERVVYGRPPFSLVIGNAQHVRLTYDDQPVDLNPYVKVEVARFTLK
jgi:cytoskeleton protein RodZ